MAPCVYIVNEPTTRLWGLTSRERLKRTVQQAGVSNVVDDLASIPSNSVVLLLRGDCLYDGRVLKSLVQEENLLLQLPVKQTQVAVAAVVPASLVYQARNLLSGAPVTEDIPQLRKVGLEALTSSLFQQLLLKQ